MVTSDGMPRFSYWCLRLTACNQNIEDIAGCYGNTFAAIPYVVFIALGHMKYLLISMTQTRKKWVEYQLVMLNIIIQYYYTRDTQDK